MPDSPLANLNNSLAALRARQVAEGDWDGAALAPGITLHVDPAAGFAARWSSPRARLLALRTSVTAPGGWCGLHVTLPAFDTAGLGAFGFVARTAAAHPLAIRVSLRSGVAGGFADQFFDRHILSQSEETDHYDILAPDRRPGLPPQAPWRELVLFLPPGFGFHWALHDLRLFAV